jgi:hypothetical protein
MAAPTYATDLTDYDQADNVANYSALGGGAAALADETDYWIETPQCVSKAGFTATTKGIMLDDGGSRTVTSGDAIFVWGKQNNRNLMDTIANGGMQVVVGNSTSAYDHFYVDGSNSDGSDLAGWRTYAVDPTQTPSTTTGGGAAGTNLVGLLWKILGSGSLKGNPNAIDVQRHGRELQCTDGDGTSGYATFDGAADFDADNTRRWGILTPTTGAYQFHGCLAMGTASTSVDFRDSARNIVVLEDPFLPSTFNEFEIRNASSNVEWNTIQITALGTTAPFVLTLDVGTFTGDLCRFDGAGQTTFASTSSCTNTTWVNSGNVDANDADLSGSAFLTPTVATDGAAVTWTASITGTANLTDLSNTTFEMGANNHHAISFSTGVAGGADITLTGIEFTGFDADGVGDSDNSILEFLATSGTITVNLIGCTVDGAGASGSNFTVDTRAGCTVNVNFDPKTVLINVKNEDGTNLQNARVFLETAATAASGEAYQATVSSLTQSAGTATATSTAHGLENGDKMVIRGAQPDGYNKVATVSNVTANTFDYTVDSGLSSPATGSPVVSYVAIQGLTNASGNISVSRTWGNDQDFKGWARLKNTSSPFYKDGNMAFTVDSTNGNSVNVVLLDDE